MADNGEGNGEAQVTFKVKTAGDKSHTITMVESATVLDLKTKLAGEDYENVPVERQRLIYSGRVMKNDDALSTYKIKAGNTIHMVKSAASNPAPAASSAAQTSTPQAVPTNMAAGTAANNLLAGLTGARFAGHANLPSRDVFGADGGMGAPPSEDQMADMLSNPAIAQTMNEALNNPAFVDYMIQSNPMLANMPNAREMLQSPHFRSMMTNPESLRMAARLRRMMAGGQGGGAFPAPGATDTTPAGASASDNTGGFLPGLRGTDADIQAALQNAYQAAHPQATRAAAGTQPQTGATAAAGTTPAQTGATPSATAQAGTNQPAAGVGTGAANPFNPFAALFGGMNPGAQGGAAANPYGGGLPGLPQITPEMMQQAMQMWGPGAMAPAAVSPPDNRPPEERYAEQLRQLNDMGFYDFDRNVAALRRSGGSVQGAIEHLLNG